MLVWNYTLVSFFGRNVPNWDQISNSLRRPKSNIGIDHKYRYKLVKFCTDRPEFRLTIRTRSDDMGFSNYFKWITIGSLFLTFLATMSVYFSFLATVIQLLVRFCSIVVFFSSVALLVFALEAMTHKVHAGKTWRSVLLPVRAIPLGWTITAWMVIWQILDFAKCKTCCCCLCCRQWLLTCPWATGALSCRE